MWKLNKRGFSAVEAVIIIAVLAAVGGVGYVMYSRNQDKKATEQKQTSQEGTSTGESTKAPVATKTYGHPTGVYSFEYPENWQLKEADNVPVSPEYDINLPNPILTPDNSPHFFKPTSDWPDSVNHIDIYSYKAGDAKDVLYRWGNSGGELMEETTKNGYTVIYDVNVQDYSSDANYVVSDGKTSIIVSFKVKQDERLDEVGNIGFATFDMSDRVPEIKALVDSIKFL